nr:ribonuclease H-like domain-containing protein [Tanacetum cinerariifolium]
MSYVSDFEEINGGYVAFGSNPKGGKISGKGKIRTGKLDFDDVYFVKELKFNLFSVLQMCDKKNNVLFTDTEYLVLSLEFKLPDENQLLLRVPRENNMYNVDLKNIVPSGDLTCLFAKTTLDEYNLWHRRLGHINFKTMNKLAEAVNTTCYVQNRVLVTKPQNKTPYELLLGETPSIGFMRPFGYPVTILNTLNPLGKFDGKADEGFLVGYYVSSKAFRVFNSSGPTWLFYIDTLKKTMNYQPVTKTDDDDAFGGKKPEFEGRKPESEVHLQAVVPRQRNMMTRPKERLKARVLINEVNAADFPVPAVGQISTNSTNTFSVVELQDITYSDDEEDVGAEADFTNLETTIPVSPISISRVHKDHHVTQIIGDLSSATQTKSMTRVAKDQGGLSQINNDDFHTCMFSCFLSQEEPKRVHQALKYPSWIEAMQEKLL